MHLLLFAALITRIQGLSMVSVAPVTFKYLNFGPIGGRGGVQRFFMLANGIPFQEELVTPGPAWEEVKKQMIESEENPCGAVPVTIYQNKAGKEMHISQHIAACRYFARVNKLDSGDIYKDYVQDLVADEYQSWRAEWVKEAFSSTDEEKEAYKTEGLAKQLMKFDTLYKKYATDAPYLSTNSAGKPLWGDSAIFGLVYDHIQTGFITPDDLRAYPNISNLYTKYGSIPEISKWIEEHKK